MLIKIYSNMSACHIKSGNWKRAIETADKVRHIYFCTRIGIHILRRLLLRTRRTQKHSSGKRRPKGSLGSSRRRRRRCWTSKRKPPRLRKPPSRLNSLGCAPQTKSVKRFTTRNSKVTVLPLCLSENPHLSLRRFLEQG